VLLLDSAIAYVAGQVQRAMAADAAKLKETYPAEAADERNAETHRLVSFEQTIHAGIDFRGVVPLLLLGTLFFGGIKDGHTLIPAATIIVATWTCVAGILAASVSVWAGTKALRAPQRRATTYEEELMALHRTTVRKIVGYDVALIFTVVTFIVYAIGITIGV